MSFAVAADAYDRFMGRFSVPLATVFADFAGVAPGQRALDVGCGTGAMTAELIGRVGSDRIAGVEPSPTFFASMRERFPGVDVRQAPAERIPFDDAEFDITVAELVVHFMADPVAGLREMARVTHDGWRRRRMRVGPRRRHRAARHVLGGGARPRPRRPRRGRSRRRPRRTPRASSCARPASGTSSTARST